MEFRLYIRNFILIKIGPGGNPGPRISIPPKLGQNSFPTHLYFAQELFIIYKLGKGIVEGYDAAYKKGNNG